jgi:hypothetical protein
MSMKSEGKPDLETIQNTEKTIESSRPSSLNQTVICIGEYPIKILFREYFIKNKEKPLPILIEKSSKDIAKWSQSTFDSDNILGLDMNIDKHFWYQVLPSVTENSALINRLKTKPIGNPGGAVIISSLWDGVGSALLPALISQFKEWNLNSVAFGVLPSKMQTSDVQFNAFSSLGICMSKNFTAITLLDLDRLEKYVGVNRNGSTLKGNNIINYILELITAKETFIQELSELSRAFDIRMYTILSATGASLQIYGSLENILNTALSEPLLEFDLSTASVLYVLLRMPAPLKDKLPQEKIEFAIASWIREKANLESIYVSEPIYETDDSDRIDIVMFVGGFDSSKMFSTMEKKVSRIKKQAIKTGSIKEDEWKKIVDILVPAK